LLTEETRQYVRSSVNIPVGIITQDRFYQGWVKNMAQGGLFIKVSGSFSVGQDISFYFYEETKKVTIIWIGHQRIGVKL
jgi:Tfp pilus assembly protein PilZ